MLRVFNSGSWPAVGGEIVLDTAESSHLVRVRRARVGEAVEVLDGRGGVAEGIVAVDNAKAARVKVQKITRHPAPVPRVLAVGLPKGDVFTEIVRQATELGATGVQPLLTARTEVRFAADRAEHKLERWRSAALEACKQSGNPWLPEIFAPVELEKWLKGLPKNFDEHRLVAALVPYTVKLSSLVPPRSNPPTLVCIGPEGDFSPEEYDLFRKAGFIAVRLPGHVLRVETACAGALVVINSKS